MTSVNSDQARLFNEKFRFGWNTFTASVGCGDICVVTKRTFLSFLLGSMHQLYTSERRVGRSNSPTHSHAVATAAGLRSRHLLPLPSLADNTDQPSRQISPDEPATTRTSACSDTPGTALPATITPPTKPLPLNQAPPTPQHGRFCVTRCSVEAFFHPEGRSPCCQRFPNCRRTLFIWYVQDC